MPSSPVTPPERSTTRTDIIRELANIQELANKVGTVLGVDWPHMPIDFKMDVLKAILAYDAGRDSRQGEVEELRKILTSAIRYYRTYSVPPHPVNCICFVCKGESLLRSGEPEERNGNS
jgi:hypothetical protein